MFTFLLVLEAVIAAVLVTVILMQRSEGGGLGVGGSSSGLMTARGHADFLTRATAFLAIAFVGLSILLAGLATGQRATSTIDPSLARPGAAAPAAPGAPPAGAPAAPSGDVFDMIGGQSAGEQQPATAPAPTPAQPRAATPAPAPSQQQPPATVIAPPPAATTPAPAPTTPAPAPTQNTTPPPPAEPAGNGQ